MRIAGLEIHRHSKTWRWSYGVHDYYPVDPNPRWGHGKPPHTKINDLLNRQRGEFAALLNQFLEHRDIIESVPATYWDNVFFSYLDAASLVTMLAFKAPLRYMEIGSGYSTKFARHAISGAKTKSTILSLDPEPRADIDALCDFVIRSRLEDCDLSIFDQLEPNDILFFDGSHRVFTNSDVTVFFLELMPRLKPGVIVHIHDVFLPWDYHPAWNHRLYSEQYMLAAMLLCPKPSFSVLLPNAFICLEKELHARVPAFLSPPDWVGGSFWIQMG